MSLSLQILFDQTKNSYHLSLLAGEKGLSQPVSWVYYTEDVTTLDFIRGGELAITTGMNITRIAYNTGVHESTHVVKYLSSLIKRLQSLHAAGIIINTGRYVKDIPFEILELCNKLNFPLFSIPWEIHLVDLMQDFGNRIFTEKTTINTITQCFYNLLFQPEKFNIKDLHKTKFENSDTFGIIITETTDKNKESIIKYFNFIITASIGLTSSEYICMSDHNKIICIFSCDPIPIAEKLHKILATDSRYTKMQFGISDVCQEIINLPDEYQHALLALRFVEKEKTLIFYKDLGEYKILNEIHNTKVLKKMYDYILGKMNILEKNKRNDYLKTLRLYLESNQKIQLTAEINSIHRNTVNYRIRKIRDIIKYDLQDGKKNFLLLQALYIKEFLEKNN